MVKLKTKISTPVGVQVICPARRIGLVFGVSFPLSAEAVIKFGPIG